ncbi:hypothetical protein GCM10023339_78260 [Alloalcanivorax gelatiniphagus]|tara:strand:+ start:34537 stop:34701 length:165 start_codon:yes stop_codon:yes gene_type:complete
MAGLVIKDQISSCVIRFFEADGFGGVGEEVFYISVSIARERSKEPGGIVITKLL